LKLKMVIYEAEEGGYWAEVPALPGCASQGDTIDELMSNVHEAVDGWLASDPSPAAGIPHRLGWHGTC
jgi:predicted RNase H-like HicB family nuclease